MNRPALIATTLFAFGTAGAAIDDPVRLDTGMISGATTATPDVRAFKGIPYAAPPVGDLRWRAPKPAAHWEGTRKAEEFGPVCIQNGGNLKMSEDCLYLNVWTGAKGASDKPPSWCGSTAAVTPPARGRSQCTMARHWRKRARWW
jgi:para-nitrobenzyl esterase